MARKAKDCIVMSEPTNISQLQQEQPPQQQLSFKESVLLNLQRNRQICVDEIAGLNACIKLIDQAVEQVTKNTDGLAIMETMATLQNMAQQRRRQG